MLKTVITSAAWVLLSGAAIAAGSDGPLFGSESMGSFTVIAAEAPAKADPMQTGAISPLCLAEACPVTAKTVLQLRNDRPQP